MNADQFIHAIALVESGDKEFAWGDAGLAAGRWQIHPAFYHDWCEPICPVDASWDTRFKGAVRRFYDHYQPLYIPLKIAMCLHLGVHAVLVERKWDPSYESKFQHAVGFMVDMGLMAT